MEPPDPAPLPKVKLKGSIPQPSGRSQGLSFLAKAFPSGPRDPTPLTKQWVLPSFLLPRPKIPLSAIAQIDGLLHSCLGVRIERDVCALSSEDAFCDVFGRDDLLATSTFVGLYVCNFDLLAETVNVVATNNSCGLFVVPTWPDHGSLIVSNKDTSPSSWFRVLKAAARIEFQLSPSFWKPGSKPAGNSPILALFVSFGCAIPFKSKPRPETSFSLLPVKLPVALAGGKLGVLPFIPTRASPLADSLAPSRSTDSVSSSTSFAGRHGTMSGKEMAAKTADFSRDNPDFKLPLPPSSWNTKVLKS